MYHPKQRARMWMVMPWDNVDKADLAERYSYDMISVFILYSTIMASLQYGEFAMCGLSVE